MLITDMIYALFQVMTNIVIEIKMLVGTRWITPVDLVEINSAG